MKKNLFAVLLLVLAMLLSVAVAENTNVPETQTVSEKINLWSHDVVIMDQAGEMTTYPLNVTFEPKAPVELTILPVAEQLQNEIFMATVSREGLANVMIAISPADRGLHFNLNNYTDEMMNDYILSVAADNFPDGEYVSEVRKSEGGNTYVSVGTEYQETLSTIYDDFVMEFFLMHDPVDGELVPLTEEDRAFNVEMFQSVWTEEAKTPTMDTALELSINEKFVSDLGFPDAASLTSLLNQMTIQVHGQTNYIHMALKNGSEEVLYFDMSMRDDGSVVLLSNSFGDKGILLTTDFLKKAQEDADAAAAADAQKATDLFGSLGEIDLTNSLTAILTAAEITQPDERTVQVTISAENAKNILNAIKDDVKASGMIQKLIPAGMNISDADIDTAFNQAVESISSSLREHEFLDFSIGTNESGDQVIAGTIKYNGTDYELDETTYDLKTITVPSTLSFATIVKMSNDGMRFEMAEYNGPDGADVLSTILMNVDIPSNGEFGGDLTYGTSDKGVFKSIFAVTLKNTKASEELGEIDTTKVAFSLADAEGTLNELFNVVSLFSGRGADNIQAFMLNVTGYEDPILSVRTTQVFGQDVEVPEVTNLVPIDQVTPEMTQEIQKTVMEKLGSLTAPKAETTETTETTETAGTTETTETAETAEETAETVEDAVETVEEAEPAEEAEKAE